MPSEQKMSTKESDDSTNTKNISSTSKNLSKLKYFELVRDKTVTH